PSPESTRMTAEKPIRLVLAGNDAIVLACLERLFALEADLAVIARCGKAEDVLGILRALRPDVLLLDLPGSAEEGLALLREMIVALPTRAILLTGALAESELAAAVGLGVRGIVPKEISPSLLAQCIRKVHAGGFRLLQASGAVSSRAKGRQKGPADNSRALTPRETRIAKLICENLGNRQIAERLSISEATLKTHIHRIYEKLRMRDRLQIGLYGQEKWLTSPNGPDTSE
ncbi:MAG TPA: response regulator transcription factor, partial [Thermoanaerobaculia bacterium]|nr:response regulator transcription factor [Thermoanaerobaculia bacterium]